MRQYLMIYFLIICPILALGQTSRYNLPELLEQNKIEVFNREIVESSDSNMESVHLSSSERDGVAWLQGIDFSNGIIEIDIKGKDVLQHSFVGIAFHGVDLETFDAVYFRPFNFQSTDSIRKIHSVQYISHPDFPWNLLRERFNGKYEKSVSPVPNPDAWFHVKIIIEDNNVKVFVDDSTDPCLTVGKLNSRTSGKVGLWVGNTSDGDFANLTITKSKK
jgi:hypothetical protein